MNLFTRVALATGVAGLALCNPLASPAFAQEAMAEKPMADAPYWDASLPIEQRVADLMARMTTEEKLAQMVAIWTNKSAIQDDANFFDPAKASELYPNGLGFFTRPSDLKGPGSPRVNTIVGPGTRGGSVGARPSSST